MADAAATSARTLESIRYDYGRINWVAWKGDDHLLAGIEAFVGRESDRRSANRTSRNDGEDVSIFRVVSISRDGGAFVQMFEGQTDRLAWGYGSTALLDILPQDREHVLLTAADNMGIGVWLGDVRTGRVERVTDGTWETRSYAIDGAGHPVLRIDEVQASGGYRIMRRASGESRWAQVMDVRGDLLTTNPPDFRAIGPGPGANQVYVFARLEQQDRGAFYLFDTSTGAFGEPLYADPEVDASDLWLHPSTRQVIAGCSFSRRLVCRARDAQVQRHLAAVNGFFGNTATVDMIDMSADASRWLIRAESPTEAAGYFVYDMAQRSVTPLAAVYPNLDLSQLAPTQVVDYQSRDGTPLWAYVTARDGTGPRPLVVLPHGGPEARDTYGYDAFAQFLAAHGYVVVQPNFRGSAGFGRAFADAGRGQWGRRMQDDVTDAIRHLIVTRVADPNRICIVGASYGGYAALAGAVFTPDLYRCAVSISGVSDLPSSLRTERAESGARSRAYQYWRRSMGEDREALVDFSPATHAARVRVPVLLVHGEDDQTVVIRQSEIMEQALTRAGKQVRFVRLANADHYWDQWSVENRTRLFQEVETFLGENLR